jgi:hypothetical protein
MSSDEGARAAAIEALRNRPVAPEPTEEEVLAAVPLREVPELEVAPLATPPLEVATTNEATNSGDEPVNVDAVEEIFARLRKATLEERGATATPKRAAAAVPQGAVEELFSRRDAAVAGALALLTRKVKRALQDDQNLMIERLRGVNGLITTELEDEFEQRTRYAEAAEEALREAAVAGVAFVHEETGSAVTGGDDVAAADAARDLAVTLVVALRKRVLAEGNGDGAERVNAAYKEWRGARVERLCGDIARRAFHAGVVAASQGRDLKFVPAPNDAPCDACARDGAGGARPAGQVFPSGQPYPPLHAGCGCLVLPA